MDASEQPREHACMQACQDASTHCHEGTRLESSREGFGTRLRPPPIARASGQARMDASEQPREHVVLIDPRPLSVCILVKNIDKA